MYAIFLRKNHSPHIPSVVCRFVSNCPSYRRHRPTVEHHRLLKLIPPPGQLKFVAIDMLAQMSRTRRSDLFHTCCDRMLRQADQSHPGAKIASYLRQPSCLTTALCPITPRTLSLTDNGLQCVSKSFATLCASLGAKLVTATDYLS